MPKLKTPTSRILAKAMNCACLDLGSRAITSAVASAPAEYRPGPGWKLDPATEASPANIGGEYDAPWPEMVFLTRWIKKGETAVVEHTATFHFCPFCGTKINDPEEQQINPRDLTPVDVANGRVFPLPDGTFAVCDHTGWYPGRYDSVATAAVALTIPWDDLDGVFGLLSGMGVVTLPVIQALLPK